MLGFLDAGQPQARRSDPWSIPLDDTMWLQSLSPPEVLARATSAAATRTLCVKPQSHVLGDCRKGLT
jgi:hypothetical protein